MSDFILNKEQQRAVKYNKGPLLIIAGAGTGKTIETWYRSTIIFASKKS